jgi:hypothetical protein
MTASPEMIRDHVHRYFVAVHGKDYVYSAPELFPNAVERWMLAIVSESDSGAEMAEKEIKGIENFCHMR